MNSWAWNKVNTARCKVELLLVGQFWQEQIVHLPYVLVKMYCFVLSMPELLKKVTFWNVVGCKWIINAILIWSNIPIKEMSVLVHTEHCFQCYISLHKPNLLKFSKWNLKVVPVCNCYQEYSLPLLNMDSGATNKPTFKRKLKQSP
jgi:hypothetical protein